MRKPTEKTENLNGTRNERLAGYQYGPCLLYDELGIIFKPNLQPTECDAHNRAVEKIRRLYPDTAKLLHALYRAIIHNVKNEL